MRPPDLRVLACGLIFVSSAAAAETRCVLSAQALSELREALNGQIAWLEANVVRLEHETGIEPLMARKLVAQHRALLASARDAQRLLADQIEHSVSTIPAITCRNSDEGEVK